MPGKSKKGGGLESYSPYKMKGHTLPGIKQNPSSPFKIWPYVAGAVAGAVASKMLAGKPKAASPGLTDPGEELGNLKIGSGENEGIREAIMSNEESPLSMKSPIKNINNEGLAVNLRAGAAIKDRAGVTVSPNDITTPFKFIKYKADEDVKGEKADQGQVVTQDTSSDTVVTNGDGKEGGDVQQRVEGAVASAVASAVMDKILNPKKAPAPNFKSAAGGFSKIKFG